VDGGKGKCTRLWTGRPVRAGAYQNTGRRDRDQCLPEHKRSLQLDFVIYAAIFTHTHLLAHLLSLAQETAFPRSE
jgi:hypothetical protein